MKMKRKYFTKQTLRLLDDTSFQENEILFKTLKSENLEFRIESDALTEKLLHENLEFMDRDIFYEKLQSKHDEMRGKMNDLNAS